MQTMVDVLPTQKSSVQNYCLKFPSTENESNTYVLLKINAYLLKVQNSMSFKQHHFTV